MVMNFDEFLNEAKKAKSKKEEVKEVKAKKEECEKDEECEDKDEKKKGLTAGQKKLPEALQKAILKKQNEK